MLNNLFWLVPIGSIMALGFAYFFYKEMLQESEGTDTMKKIAQYVREGAMAYLKQQYKVVSIIFVILTIIFAILAYVLKIQNPWVPFAFLTGGFFSGLAGFIGMKTATYASARTANAAQKSLNHGLRIAFRSGAVMGLTVVGLGLLDISIWFYALNYIIGALDTATDLAIAADPSMKLIIITTTTLTFGMGASTQALFARVGGGIYTKAADVGADLVGKVEAGIPEDDPRNPATIADNVGDNVGDVAGMGADLYESYCGAILSTAALGATGFTVAAMTKAGYSDVSSASTQFNAVIAPMLIAAVGIVLSILGIFMVRTKEDVSQKQLLSSLSRGVNFSSVFIALFSFLILWLLEIPNFVGVWGAMVAGLVGGIGIGKTTEYYTSAAYKPTQSIAGASKTGPATVIINGIGIGMISTAIPPA
jgi:K(+)-stimulated pyrophosphate-energized sodium pump